MDNMMQCFWPILLLSSLRGILSFACFWVVFDNFFSYQSRSWKKSNWIWVLFYVLISLLYRFVINYGPVQFARILLLIDLVRIIPFLWSKYGFNLKFIVMVVFYENIVNCFAQNVQYLFAVNIFDEVYRGMRSDSSIVITEFSVFVLLLILSVLRKTNIIKIYFTELTIMEYIILFLNSFFSGLLQNAVLRQKVVGDTMRGLSFVSYGLLMVLILHVIMVRDQNKSMNAMIGNLKEPMKQITDSYVDMNEKNTELRRFRHDTKNLLLVLRSLVLDGKKDQAVEYIDEMQGTLETIKVKAFDTGNFIADALLESKSKLAAQNNIVLTATGNIPANRIEDVNLVILISNLVDNAIEATKQVEGEKKIEIQSMLKKNIWVLSVKNPCVKDVVIRENRIETTKNNREAHGFGLSNIERVTRKYAGELKLRCENKEFTAVATIMLTA